MPTKMTIVTPFKNFAITVEDREAAYQVCANINRHNGILTDTLWIPVNKVEGVQFEEITPQIQHKILELETPDDVAKPKSSKKKDNK